MGGLVQIEATFVVLAMERGFYFNVYISVMSFIQHEIETPSTHAHNKWIMEGLEGVLKFFLNATTFSLEQEKFENGYKDPPPPCPTISKEKKIFLNKRQPHTYFIPKGKENIAK